MTGSGKDHVVYHTREWCRIQGIRQLFVVKCSQLCFGLDAMISIFFSKYRNVQQGCFLQDEE